MIYVVAGNMQQYMHYCHINKVHPRQDAYYIMDASRLRGHHWVDGDKLVYYGTYRERRDLVEILDYVRYLNGCGIKIPTERIIE